MKAWEAVLGGAVVAAGAWVRAWHLGTPSLWWDEVVHVRTADLPSALDVARIAWLGVFPGKGNAGAVPLDYLLLHAWLRLVPAPEPDMLEAYLRVPAFLAAAAAPAALWLLFRRVVGPVAAVLAAAVLAASVFHVLYAAEARFHAALVLATVVQLAVYYLHARGLDPRVVLRGFADARRVLAQLRRECPDACRSLGRVGPVDGRLGVGDPYDQMPPMRWLVGIDGPAARPPLRVGDTVVVVYGRSGEREQAGFVRAGYRGLATFAPVTDPVVAR